MPLSHTLLHTSNTPIVNSCAAPARVPSTVLQCVAVCCSVLQCAAVCCSVLQCVAVCWYIKYTYCQLLRSSRARPWHRVAVCCSVLQCVAVCCSVLQCVDTSNTPIFNSCAAPARAPSTVLRCVAVYCSVLQCVAVCCSVLMHRTHLSSTLAQLPRASPAPHACPPPTHKSAYIYTFTHICLYRHMNTSNTHIHNRAATLRVLQCVAVCWYAAPLAYPLPTRKSVHIHIYVCIQTYTYIYK